MKGLSEKTETTIADCEYCDIGGICDREFFIKTTHFYSLSQILAYYEKYTFHYVSRRYRTHFHILEEAEAALKEREENGY